MLLIVINSVYVHFRSPIDVPVQLFFRALDRLIVRVESYPLDIF